MTRNIARRPGASRRDRDGAALLLAELMGDLAQKDVLQADVVVKRVGQLGESDAVEARPRQYLRGVDVLALLGEAEDIAAEKKVGDAAASARQIAKRLHRTIGHDEQPLRGGILFIHDRPAGKPKPRGDLNQRLALALGQERSAVRRQFEVRRDANGRLALGDLGVRPFCHCLASSG
jgi:hypothetical protein